MTVFQPSPSDSLPSRRVPVLDTEMSYVDVGQPNQREVTVEGIHDVQEDSPVEIGAALHEFLAGLRGR